MFCFVCLQMTRIIQRAPASLAEVTETRRLQAICDDSLVQQNRRYDKIEQKLYSLYKKWWTQHELEDLYLIDKYEDRLICVYEDIILLYAERQKLQNALEKLQEKNREEAMDICDKKISKVATDRIDREWENKKRNQLFEKMELVVKEECRSRAWYLNDVMSRFARAATIRWKRYDADREEKKKYVDEYLTNLLSYAVRIGQYPEILNDVRGHLMLSENLHAEVARNFEKTEQERVKNELELYKCSMTGQSTRQLADQADRCSSSLSHERQYLYRRIYESKVKIESHDAKAKLLLQDLYEKRGRFIAKQLIDVEEILLKGKSERETFNPKNILVLPAKKLSRRRETNV